MWLICSEKGFRASEGSSFNFATTTSAAICVGGARGRRRGVQERAGRGVAAGAGSGAGAGCGWHLVGVEPDDHS